MWFRDFFTGRFSGLSKAVPLQRSTTNETQDTARTLDKHFDNNLDDMIETGSDGTEEKNLEKSVQSQRPMSLRNSIMGRKFQILIAMAILFGLILILGSLLVISRHRSEGSQQMSNPSGNANSAWHDTATWSGGLSPYPSPTTSGQTPASPPSYLYPRPSPSGASFPSVESQLSAVIDTSTLQNSQTPLGIAYKWITQQDDLSSTTKSYPTVVQRFALAAFYFATGGGRTQATWNVCSAVPANVVKDRNSFSTKCVFGEGIEYGQVVCAGSQAFLECPEYYAGSPAPTDPKKRWLSDTSECDWYGVSCNRDGIVEELALPQNGLKGTLLPELDLLSDMKSLDLSSNTLTGTLPDWQALEYMEQVVLSNLTLQGQVPLNWTTWSELGTLELADNQLTGFLTLPGEWMKLYKVNVSNNALEINLPPNIGQAVRLETLAVSGNNVGGTLPSSVGNLESLQRLDISEAGMSGTIPDLGSLSNLVELDLQGNSFTGTIPDFIYGLSNLQVLRLGPNQLSGSLSTQVANLRGLVHLSIEGLNLQGSIPVALGKLTMLEDLQLQDNSFTGAVPVQICDISGLNDLWADCKGPGSLSCSCCTHCCDNLGNCNGP